MDDLAERRRHIITVVENIILQLVSPEWKEYPSGSWFLTRRFSLFLIIITA